ncbi:MAG TPA: hypothetical protein VK119_09640 [Bacillota bacterium]|nr:hypothetical protein [Bacillota bacterium]
MKINKQHIQPMKLSTLLKYTKETGKGVFLLSVPGNILILVLSTAVLFAFFDYVDAVGMNENGLHTLTIFNNVLLIGLTCVHIYYLLLGNHKLSFWNQVKQSLIKTLKILPTLIVATFVYALFVTIGLFLLIIPGLILYAYLGIYSQTIAFENKGMLSSLLRSRDLVKGSFWKVFCILIILLLSTNIVVSIMGIVSSVFLPNSSLVFEIGVYSVAYLPIMPFIGSMYAFLYFDLRSRQESFDYQVFEQELEM